MNLSIGIVGLPNVGKSTLFNALLKKQIASAENYPFCTIEPNVGIIPVPNYRLSNLASIVKTDQIVPAVVKFYDIAGLVKGASTGQGLGNKFLSHIREVNTIAHVVRFFEDENVIHVDNTINSSNDIRTIDAELSLADLSTLEKQPEPRMNSSKEEVFTYEVIRKIKEALNSEIPVRKQSLSEEERKAVKQLNLLTAKPVIYVFNVSETQLEKYSGTLEKISKLIQNLPDDSPFLIINAKLENEVLALSADEQQEYLKQYNLSETGLNRLIGLAYSTLGLISFLTAGEKEVKAWTITKGTLAPEAASVIHTDFGKNFIKANIVSYGHFMENNGWQKCFEKGLVNIVGKDYEIMDNDIVEFMVSGR